MLKKLANMVKQVNLKRFEDDFMEFIKTYYWKLVFILFISIPLMGIWKFLNFHKLSFLIYQFKTENINLFLLAFIFSILALFVLSGASILIWFIIVILLQGNKLRKFLAILPIILSIWYIYKIKPLVGWLIILFLLLSIISVPWLTSRGLNLIKSIILSVVFTSSSFYLLLRQEWMGDIFYLLKFEPKIKISYTDPSKKTHYVTGTLIIETDSFVYIQDTKNKTIAIPKKNILRMEFEKEEQKKTK